MPCDCWCSVVHPHVPGVGLQCVVVVLPDHTHFLIILKSLACALLITCTAKKGHSSKQYLFVLFQHIVICNNNWPLIMMHQLSNLNLYLSRIKTSMCLFIGETSIHSFFFGKGFL